MRLNIAGGCVGQVVEGLGKGRLHVSEGIFYGVCNLNDILK